MAEETFLDVFCRFRHHFRNLFMLSLLSLVILIAVLPGIERGSETYVITAVQITTFTVILVLSLGFMVFCGRRSA